MKFDLHSHSYFSDGDLSPTDLLQLADENGINYLALTDHDTVDGISEAQNAAKQLKVNLIEGLELSCTWNGQLLHIVGLGVDVENSELLAGIEQNKQLREVRAAAMLEDFSRHGIELSEEISSVLNGAVPTRPHFAQALVNLGYAKNKNQAFKRFLVRGKPGFVAMQWPSLEKVGVWINAAGGIGVLAHPLRYKFTRTKLQRLIVEMKGVGIRAMEISNANTDQQQLEGLASLAIQHGLLASVGSDFHSLNQPWARIGGATDLPAHVTPVWSELC